MQDEKKMYLLTVLKGKWRLLIIEDLFDHDKQFNEIQNDIKGISAKVLSDNLQYLTRSGIINRSTYPAVFPPKVVYSLSDRGMRLKPILNDIFEWSMENYTPIKEEPTDEFFKIFQ